MKSEKFFRTCLTFSLFLLGTSMAPAMAQSDKPNVVLMLADNLGYGDLSVYNDGIRGGMKTPNIDKLASEGMRMTQFLVEPGCTPSRAWPSSPVQNSAIFST